MEILIKKLHGIMEKCRLYGDKLEKELVNDHIAHDPRHSCFAMVFNNSTITLELLSYYYEIWGKMHGDNVEEIERAKKENAERCIESTKWLFIGSMSSMEFCVKESIKLYPKSSIVKELQRKKYIYLSDIVRKSSEEGLISKKAEEDWIHIIELRNLVVHNNGIADKDDSYSIGSLCITLMNGKMAKGKLDFFIDLVEFSIENYNSLINNLVKYGSTI